MSQHFYLSVYYLRQFDDPPAYVLAYRAHACMTLFDCGEHLKCSPLDCEKYDVCQTLILTVLGIINNVTGDPDAEMLLDFGLGDSLGGRGNRPKHKMKGE